MIIAQLIIDFDRNVTAVWCSCLFSSRSFRKLKTCWLIPCFNSELHTDYISGVAAHFSLMDSIWQDEYRFSWGEGIEKARDITRNSLAQCGLNTTITPLSSLYFNVKFNDFQKTATATATTIVSISHHAAVLCWKLKTIFCNLIFKTRQIHQTSQNIGYYFTP